MSQPDAPKAPDPAKSYEKEIAIYLQNLPQLLQAEQDARTTYDPQRIAEQQGLQAQFGPTQYAQQLDALNQLDPQGVKIRGQLGDSVSGDLASGYNVPQDLMDQITQSIRAGQVARGGSVYGNAPVSAEAITKGKFASDLYQQHIDNAGQFLGLSTPEQQISQITPVSADQTSAYTNPSAGFAGQNFALSNYGNQLGAYNATAAQGNPWARALGGAASGAAAGSAAGGWGALIGGVAGAAGGYFSDARLKENIIFIGTSPNNHRIYEFNYKGFEGSASLRYRGVLAQEVFNTNPDAISFKDGYMLVDYDQIGIPFEEVEHA